MIENLAPDIFRQRLLMEGFWRIAVDEHAVRRYLLGLAGETGLRSYGEPIVFSPSAGEGRPENAGFDAFLPLIDSGIAGYFWTGPRFLSVVLYSCKPFEAKTAAAYTRRFFDVDGELAQAAF